jgi:hypothetical protein
MRHRLVGAVADLRPQNDPPVLEIATVTCTECGATIGEDQAQAQRWGFWSDGLSELYPFCAECAAGKFGHGSG